MKVKLLLLPALFAAISCNTNSNQPAASAPVASAVVMDSTKVKFTAAMVDNKKDFACGMPVTAGIEDTCQYNNKVYGFCSKECKEEFLKKPAFYLTSK